MSKGIREMTDHQLKAAAEAGEITASALVTEQDRRHAVAHPTPVVEGWTLDRVMLRPGTAFEELLYYRRRVQELLEATNRYLERARAAEAFIASKSVGAVAHIHKHGLKLLADGLRTEVYPTNVTHEHMRPLFVADQPEARPTFQDCVQPWMLECFGVEIAGDKLERGDRLLEEVFELLQSGGYPRERIRALEGYVFSRPAGEPRQEVGGVMVTLAAYCLAHDINMHDAGETELARVWTKVEAIRAKQAAKPTGSALPTALTAETTRMQEALDGLLETDTFLAKRGERTVGTPLSGVRDAVRSAIAVLHSTLVEALPVSVDDASAIEEGAKILAKWIGYAWDGIPDRDISDRYPDWSYNGAGSVSMQGGKPALRKVVKAILDATAEKGCGDV